VVPLPAQAILPLVIPLPLRVALPVPVGWHFYDDFVDLPNVPAADPSVRAQYQILELKLREIGETRCFECGGFGHTRRKCHTYKKLIEMASGVNVWKTILN
jgi:hypothetical protein